MTSTLARPSRRTIVRGAAWSVPVVSLAAAAPAFAASACQLNNVAFRLNWGTSGWSRNTDGSGGVGTAGEEGPAILGANPVAVTFASTYIRSSGVDRRASDNLTVTSETNVGGAGAGERALRLRHLNHGGTRDFRQVLNFKFDRAVTNLKFRISDIDSLDSTFWDRVELSGTRSGARASGVIGAGVDGPTNGNGNNNNGPWRLSATSNNLGLTSTVGIVDVTFSGTIPANTNTTLTYWSARAGSEQYIFLSDFTFNAKGC